MQKLLTITAAAALVAALGFAGTAWAVPKDSAGGAEADFALLDEEPTVEDVSVQCGAFRDIDRSGTVNAGDEPAAFLVHITMTNRGDLGGADGGVRVTYKDTDFVDYPIAAGETVNITMAAGGTPDVDDLITVTSSPGPLAGALLIGQMSIFVDRKKAVPHPDVAPSFCTTTPKP